jgi:hypothetical protein
MLKRFWSMGDSKQVGQPWARCGGIPGVTSSFDAVIEPYHFYLDTIHDVPASWHFGTAGAGLPLFFRCSSSGSAISAACANRFLYDDTIEPRTLITLLGISLAAWAVLCARVGLAFRYAANPGTVDALAIGGLTLSLGATGVSSCVHPRAGVPVRRQEAGG